MSLHMFQLVEPVKQVGFVTPDELRATLSANGMTLAQYARNAGVDPKIAVQLVNGYAKGRFGKSHQAAVALGLKEAA